MNFVVNSQQKNRTFNANKIIKKNKIELQNDHILLSIILESKT